MGLAVLKAHIVRGSRVVILNDPRELASAVTTMGNANHCIALRPAKLAAHLRCAVPLRLPVAEPHLVRLVVTRPVVLDDRSTLAGIARARADDHCVARRQS